MRENVEDKVSACGIAGEDEAMWVYAGAKKITKSLVGVD